MIRFREIARIKTAALEITRLTLRNRMLEPAITSSRLSVIPYDVPDNMTTRPNKTKAGTKSAAALSGCIALRIQGTTSRCNIEIVAIRGAAAAACRHAPEVW